MPEASAADIYSPELVATMWCMLVDHVTATVSADFEARGIASIVLKGPAFARLLYDDDERRCYTDTDLLVQEDDRDRATEALTELGFVRIDRDEDWIGPEPKYAHTYQRPDDGALVDLHWRVSGVEASAQAQWNALSGHLAEVMVGDRAVQALDPCASALLVALHNAHHGTGRPTTLADLDRAVQRWTFDIWLDAVCLADELGASRPFAAGLRLTDAGDALADRLCLGRPASVEMWLKTNPSSYGAYALDRIAQTKGLGPRLRVLAQVIWPPRVIMYRAFPLARRGRVGLVLAYLIRPFRLILNAGPALRDLARARSAMRAGDDRRGDALGAHADGGRDHALRRTG